MTRDNDTDDDSLFEKADAAFRQATDSLASGEHGPGKE